MPKAKATPTPAPQEEQKPQPLQYDVNIYPGKGDGAQKASATVNINGQFAIRGLKIMEGTKGLFVSMPSYKVGNEYKDICFPCTKESHEQLNSAVMNAYEQALTQKQTQSEAPVPQQTPAMSGQSM